MEDSVKNNMSVIPGKKPRKTRKERRNEKRARKHPFAKKLCLAMTLFLLAFVLFAAAKVFSLDAWHELDPKKILDANLTLLIYDQNGNEISALHKTEDRIWVPLHDIPDVVQKAFISAEDARFYEHKGIDVIRIAGAALEDIKQGGYAQGASTITQQLIKLSHLTSEKTMTRKIEEAILAYRMEQTFSKDEILEMYLNYVYFGGGFYGIEAAARGYYGISASELTAEQGALLAGILKSPTAYSPHNDLEASHKRRDNVLRLMNEYGYLSDADYREAVNTDPLINYEQGRGQNRGYYVDTVLSEACSILDIDMDTLLIGGYSIYTGLDQELQSICEDVYENDELFPDKNVQSAITIIDPKTGYVRAIVGGRGDAGAMAYNRATQIRRQPGSVIKPIIAYAPALEYYGYTAATEIVDEPRDYNGYRPTNIDGNYRGSVTLRQAVQSSINIPAVEVLNDIGVESGKRFAKKLGIEFDERDNSLALALGGFTYGVSPLQIAGAYGAFANGGMYTEPSFISRISDREGNIVYDRTVTSQRVMSEGNAYVLTSMLESAIKSGTGHRLGELGITLAGKTGTVGDQSGNRDAWMAAYNSEYSAAIWMGYDTYDSGQFMPGEASGGMYPALVLRDVFGKIYENKKSPEFSVPDNIVNVRLDKFTLDNDHLAVLANAFTPQDSTFTEVFVRGTEPTSFGTYWSIPEPPDEILIVLGENDVRSISFTAKNNYVIYKLYREDAAGNAVELAELSGSMLLSYDDTEDIPSGTYEYYVIPVHPELTIGGMPVTGPASAKVSVYTEGKLSLAS